MSIVEVSEIKPTERLLGLIFLMGFFVSLELVVKHSISDQSIYIVAVITGFIFSLRVLTELSARQIHRLTGERRFLDPLVEDSDLRVMVTINNNGYIPILKATITDLYPRMFHLVNGSNTIEAVIPGKSSISFTYTVKPVLGKHRYKGVEIIVSDPLKIFNYKAILSIKEDTLYVKPKPLPLPRRVRIPTASRFLGLGKIRLRGIGQEFYTLREYYPGDDYRFIEWKAFARSRKLYVKEFEREASLSAIVAIYVSRDSIRGMIRSTVLEYMARTAASITKSMLERGDWVELLLIGSEILRSGYGRGRLHFYNIVKILSMFDWRPAKSISLGRILVEETYRIPRRTKNYYIVFTTPLDKKEMIDFINYALMLRQQRHIIVLVQALPELFEEKIMRRKEIGEFYAVPLIDKIIEARKKASFFRRHGILTVNVGPDDILDQTLLILERYRALTI